MENIEPKEAFHRGAGAEDGRDDDGQEIDQDVLVREHAIDHILKAVILLGALVLHVLELGVVLVDLEHHGYHERQEYHRTADADAFQRNTYLFAQQSRDDGCHTDSCNDRDDAFHSQNAVALGGAVRQRRDHRLHRNLGQRTGEVIEQISHKKPGNLESIRCALGHQEKQDRRDWKGPEEQPVPGHILTFTGKFSKQLPVLDVDTVYDIAKQHIIHRVNDLDEQDRRGQGRRIDTLEHQEHSHVGANK